MEDTFRVRVDKVFGALGGDAPSSVGVTPALWCLTDEEIERREWNRSKHIPEEDEYAVESRPSILQTDLESDLKELSDYEEGEEGEDEEAEEIDGAKKRRRSVSDGDARVEEYFDVRSNIGRDCTLDYEDEEDEYDKVAVGTKKTDDRVYMRDVKYADYGIDEISEYGELPSSFKTAAKDPRANHSAAIVRLREDAEAAGEFDALQLSDSSMGQNLDAEDVQKGEVDVDNPKPILKKREHSIEAKSQKRVRFMVDSESGTHENQQTASTSDLTSKPLVSDDKLVKEPVSDLSEYSAGVPDYLRNPSRYTHYTFDSSDEMSEESNREAYASFFNELRKRNTDTLMEETPVEMPKSVVFTPKKKPGNDLAATSDKKPKTKENQENKRWSVDITAEDNQESESSAMEEDEPVQAVTEGVRSSQKSSRQYRKTNIDVDENLD